MTEHRTPARAQVVALIKEQLTLGEAPASCPEKWPLLYGKVELRELLDFIYGGPPEIKEEEI